MQHNLIAAIALEDVLTFGKKKEWRKKKGKNWQIEKNRQWKEKRKSENSKKSAQWYLVWRRKKMKTDCSRIFFCSAMHAQNHMWVLFSCIFIFFSVRLFERHVNPDI
jgi:hypothetical protein